MAARRLRNVKEMRNELAHAYPRDWLVGQVAQGQCRCDLHVLQVGPAEGRSDAHHRLGEFLRVLGVIGQCLQVQVGIWARKALGFRHGGLRRWPMGSKVSVPAARRLHGRAALRMETGACGLSGGLL